jgi:predicted RNase H-like nuclease (RuvC/YqgF family)
MTIMTAEQIEDLRIEVHAAVLALSNSHEKLRFELARVAAELEEEKNANLPLYSDRIRNLEDKIAAMTAERDALRAQLERNRQGYLNILEFRKIAGSGARYGALSRDELEEVIRQIDAALAGVKQ